MLQENCYVVSDETGDAVIVDPGMFYDEERQAVADYVRRQQLTLRHVLCTHGHFDHIFGVDSLYKTFGLEPEVHSADMFLIDGFGQQCEALLGMKPSGQLPPVSRQLADGDRVDFGSHRLQVLHTPGHSPGSVLFYCEEEHVVFTGDTLFRMSVGRTDLEGGSWTELMNSLKHVVALLPADTTAYTGHGPATKIAEELRMNPYLYM